MNDFALQNWLGYLTKEDCQLIKSILKDGASMDLLTDMTAADLHYILDPSTCTRPQLVRIIQKLKEYKVMNQASSTSIALRSSLKRQQQSVRQVQFDLQPTDSASQIIASAASMTNSSHWYDGKNEHWIISYANGEFQTAFALLLDGKDYQQYANILPHIFNDCIITLKQSGHLPFSANDVISFLFNFISLMSLNDINTHLDGRSTVQTLLTVIVEERDDLDSVWLIFELLKLLLVSEIDGERVINAELKCHLQAVVDVHNWVDLMRQYKTRKYAADVDGEQIINSSDEYTNRITIQFQLMSNHVLFVLLKDRIQPEDQRIRTTLLYSGIIPLMDELAKTWSDEKMLVENLGILSRFITTESKPKKAVNQSNSNNIVLVQNTDALTSS